MERNSKSWRIKLIFILIIVALIKYGSSAPSNSRLDKIPSKTKRSADFMNYINYMFYDNSFNYPTYNWNPYVPAQPVYETRFIQYPDNNGINGNIDTILSIDYNWPEQEMNEINPFKDVSENVNNRPLILTNVGKDDAFTYILENDCDYDLPSGTNDINWNFKPQSLDESVFHNFYLIPDQATESAPTTTPRPTEPPVEDLNKVQENSSPNISIFNCISDPGQKDIIEKALSSKDEEYMVLLIKKNPFLDGKNQDTKPETTLQQPLNNVIEPETTTYLPPTVGEHVVNDRANEIVGSPKEVGEKEIPISTVTAPPSLTIEEHAMKPTETPVKEEDQINHGIPVESSDSRIVDLDLDLKEIAEEEIVLPASTVSTTISIQEHDVKPSEILVQEKDPTNPVSLQGKVNVVIVEEKPTDNGQNEVIVDIPEKLAETLGSPIPQLTQIIEAEAVESTDSVKSVAEETKQLDNDPLDIHTKDEKDIELEVRQESPSENPEKPLAEDQAEVQISDTLIDESKIIEEAPSTLPDIVQTGGTDNIAITEKPLIIEDGKSTVVEDQNIPMESMDTSTTREVTKDLESIALPIDVLKPVEILKPFDSSDATTSVLQSASEQIDLTNNDTGIGSVDSEV